MKIKKIFLVVTFIAAWLLALLYGFSPQFFLGTLLGVTNVNINLHHLFRAVMCLYFALGLFWLFSAFNAKFRDAAVLSVAFFAGGLMIGRIISFIVDGWPSPLLVSYFFIEVVYLPAAYWVYKLPE